MVYKEKNNMHLIIKELMNENDENWYLNMLHNKVYVNKLTSQDCNTVIEKCLETSIYVKDMLIEKFGKLSAEEYIKALGLKVEKTTGDVINEYLYMGLYQPGSHTITINKSVIDIAQQYIITSRLEEIVHADRIEEAALYHELFHAIEDKITGIYTRSKMLKRKHLGVFTHYRGLDIASEIGAIHFSKIMSEIEYSPCIYEIFLLLATDQINKETLIHLILTMNQRCIL